MPKSRIVLACTTEVDGKPCGEKVFEQIVKETCFFTKTAKGSQGRKFNLVSREIVPDLVCTKCGTVYETPDDMAEVESDE